MDLRKVFLFLMVFTIVLSVSTVFALEKEYVTVKTTVTYNGKTLTNGETLKDVKAGDKITVKASCSDERAIAWSTNTNYLKDKGYTFNKDGMAFIGYMFDSTNASNYIDDLKNPTSITITIPNFAAGSEHYVVVNAVAACDGLVDNNKEIQATSGTLAYKIKMKAADPESITVTLTKDDTKATAKATPVNGTFAKFVYNWDGAANQEASINPVSFALPTSVGKHTLTVYALTKNNVKSNVATLTHEVKAPDPETITVALTKDSEKATAKATVANGTFAKFVYNWDGAANQEASVNPASFTLPTSVGKHTLTVYALTKNNVKSNVATLTHEVKAPEQLDGTIEATINDKPISENKDKPTTLNEDDGIQYTYAPVENFSKLEYAWDNDPLKELPTNPFIIPSFAAGSTHKLTFKGTLKDGGIVTKVYYITIPGGSTPDPDPEPTPEIKGEVNAKVGNTTLKAGSTLTVEESETKVVISGTPAENFTKLLYKLDNKPETEAQSGATVVVECEPGESHTLIVYGTLTNGTLASKKSYYFKREYADDLDLEDWMVENDDAEGLIVALRNSSETEKANYNFYMLNEEVIYYVDYMNAGKDINDQVKLVLNLPLQFTSISSHGGTVDKSKKTITWTFANGLKAEAAGTKVVKIKYTALSKKSLTSEMVYPQAVIYQGSKAKDYSAVINMIYKDEDTELEDSHSPYMYGDNEKPTFRPDDGISRAEGALVLMRIFGVEYKNAKITTKFSDIDETYTLAQKAISKATELGVIQGYTDGTYRPNDKMTRAEFMKIIASYVEVLGDEENVKGLEVKDDNAIWLYRKSKNKTHWSDSYVTLLCRLNMTAVRNNSSLRVDDTITRAEVAQLCNFYQFRAPVRVTSKTTTSFSDVTRSHKLFGDIVEATRATHDAYVDEEGRETGK